MHIITNYTRNTVERLNGIQEVSGSIPLISTTYLIHHICPMWFFLFIPLTAISDSLDFMRHFVPLKSVPYFAAASSHCFISISQTLRFPGISDSPDSMRHFIPLESVPYLTGLISIIYITIKKVTSLRYGLFVLLNLLTRVKSEFESGGEHECPRHG